MGDSGPPVIDRIVVVGPSPWPRVEWLGSASRRVGVELVESLFHGILLSQVCSVASVIDPDEAFDPCVCPTVCGALVTELEAERIWLGGRICLDSTKIRQLAGGQGGDS